MKISVVVPTFNRNHILIKCIDSLMNQDLECDFYEVIVVDDCSIESPYQYLKVLLDQNPNLKYIRHDVNKGLASARNTGIVNSAYEIVLFLDSDIVPDLSFVNVHLQLHKSYPNESIAVVSNLSYDNQFIEGSNFAHFVNGRYLGNRSKSEKNKIKFDNLSPQYFGGGISSVRRSSLTEVGMFDTSFVKYGGEDEDLGYRLKKNGVRICFSDKAKATHYDTITIQRFKLKAIEWKKNAFPLIMHKQPQYFDQTNLKYLMPVNLKKDKVSLILKKLFYKSLLNKQTVWSLEKFLIFTDGFKYFYSPFLIRALTTGWFLTISPSNLKESSSSVWK